MDVIAGEFPTTLSDKDWQRGNQTLSSFVQNDHKRQLVTRKLFFGDSNHETRYRRPDACQSMTQRLFLLLRNHENPSNFRRQRSKLQINMCGCALFAVTDLTPLTSSLFVHCGKGGIMTFVPASSSKLVCGNIFPSRVADTSSGDSRASFADGAFSLVVPLSRDDD